ncbi:MAG: ABC transporter permease subunit [Oscillospiraceae bacterium]|nr:ABC transporter permease subunit [Oscillospiraceae bacterium]
MKQRVTWINVRDRWQLYVLLLPALVWLGIFMYTPMYGVIIAFKDFRISEGIMKSPWAGFKYFGQFFSTTIAFSTISNTIILSMLSLLIGFPFPILFALFLNQLRSNRYKKGVQTISYAPYFISNVVVVSILSVILAPKGFVNAMIESFGGTAKLFMAKAEYFRGVYITSHIWQTMGFNAIIYIAALAGVPPELHEAAIMDGASKPKRIIHIDLPSILPTVIIMLILSIGNLMSVGYEKVYLMQGGTNTTVSEIISTYVYKVGLLNAQYSFSTAVGLFNSSVNLLLLVIANLLARKVSDISLF